MDFNENGEMICPEPTENYLPTCHQAAVINKKRCLKEGKSQEYCDQLAEDTKKRVNEFPGATGIRVFLVRMILTGWMQDKPEVHTFQLLIIDLKNLFNMV